jgi:hypothetical protein
MKIGDLVKFSEEYYPEYKGKVGMLVGSGYSTESPVWKVMIDGRMHPFHVDSMDLEVIGYDENKMIGGRL